MILRAFHTNKSTTTSSNCNAFFSVFRFMWTDPMKSSLFKRISLLSFQTCLRNSIQLNESNCLCFIHGFFHCFNFENALFRRKSCVSVLFLHQSSPVRCLFHWNRCPPLSFAIAFSVEQFFGKSQVMLLIKTESTFISVNFSSRKEKKTHSHVWDKVVVDDRRYKTSSPVCISFNPNRMRVHEHHAQKWLNACVTMVFCSAMPFHCSLAANEPRSTERQGDGGRWKNVCVRFHGLWQKNSQSTVCD